MFVFSTKLYNIKQQIYIKMSIQNRVLGFEPTISSTWASSRNHKTRLPPNLLMLTKFRMHKYDLHFTSLNRPTFWCFDQVLVEAHSWIRTRGQFIEPQWGQYLKFVLSFWFWQTQNCLISIANLWQNSCSNKKLAIAWLLIQ